MGVINFLYKLESKAPVGGGGEQISEDRRILENLIAELRSKKTGGDIGSWCRFAQRRIKIATGSKICKGGRLTRFACRKGVWGDDLSHNDERNTARINSSAERKLIQGKGSQNAELIQQKKKQKKQTQSGIKSLI